MSYVHHHSDHLIAAAGGDEDNNGKKKASRAALTTATVFSWVAAVVSCGAAVVFLVLWVIETNKTCPACPACPSFPPAAPTSPPLSLPVSSPSPSPPPPPPSPSPPSPPSPPPLLAASVGASIINDPPCAVFANGSLTGGPGQDTYFKVHVANEIDWISSVVYATTQTHDTACETPRGGNWYNDAMFDTEGLKPDGHLTREYGCGNDIMNSPTLLTDPDFLICARVTTASGGVFVLTRRAFPWPRPSSFPSLPSPPSPPPPLVVSTGASIINVPPCTSFTEFFPNGTIHWGPTTTFAVHLPNLVESIASVEYNTGSLSDSECEYTPRPWLSEIVHPCGSEIGGGFSPSPESMHLSEMDYLICARVTTANGESFVLTRRAFPWPR